MNKKGMYLVLFVIVTIVALGGLLVAILNAQLKRNDVLGLDASHLYKVYDEGEKIKFYLLLSTKYAEDKSIIELRDNAGYSRDSTCSNSDGYVLLSNKCGNFDPKQNFDIIFNKELKSYINSYDSTYEDIDLEKVYKLNWFFKFIGRIPSIVKPESSLVRDVSNSQVKSLSVVSMNGGVIKFSPIVLKLEGSAKSSYTIEPKFKFENVDFSVYDKIYSTLALGCMGKTVDECSKFIKDNLGVETIASGSIIKVEYNNIKFAFDVSDNLPQKLTGNSHTIA